MYTVLHWSFDNQYANTAILKMKQGIQADIIVDGWPAFDCTIARLPESEEVSQWQIKFDIVKLLVPVIVITKI